MGYEVWVQGEGEEPLGSRAHVLAQLGRHPRWRLVDDATGTLTWSDYEVGELVIIEPGDPVPGIMADRPSDLTVEFLFALADENGWVLDDGNGEPEVGPDRPVSLLLFMEERVLPFERIGGPGWPDDARTWHFERIGDELDPWGPERIAALESDAGAELPPALRAWLEVLGDCKLSGIRATPGAIDLGTGVLRLPEGVVETPEGSVELEPFLLDLMNNP